MAEKNKICNLKNIYKKLNFCNLNKLSILQFNNKNNRQNKNKTIFN